MLSTAVCDTMMRDASHLFRRMWPVEAWAQHSADRQPCWNVSRDASSGRTPQTAASFFDSLVTGAHCGSNWFEGVGDEALACPECIPKFTALAPALFGFDEDIDSHCATELGGSWPHKYRPDDWPARAVRANRNILAIWGERIPYNTCRNFEWAMCAATGRLPGQREQPSIVFATAPSSLSPVGGARPVGKCGGWVPTKPPPGSDGAGYGFASDDIFYIEVCLLSAVCSNSEEIFRVQRGERFDCDFSEEKFRELQAVLLQPPGKPDPEQASSCGLPSRCAAVYEVDAGGHKCGARIEWLHYHASMSLADAASQVAREYAECSACAAEDGRREDELRDEL